MEKAHRWTPPTTPSNTKSRLDGGADAGVGVTGSPGPRPRGRGVRGPSSPRSRRDRKTRTSFKSVVSASPGPCSGILPAPLGRHAGGHHQGLTDHPVAHCHIQVGGVDEDVGEPGVVQAAGQELVHALVDARSGSAKPRSGRCPTRCPGPCTGPIDLAGRHALDPGRAARRIQGLVDPAAGVEQGGEEGSGAQLGDGQLHLPGGGGELLGPRAVAPVGALRGARRGAARRSRRRPRHRPGPRDPAWSRRRKTPV